MKKLNVMSLFNGMSFGMMALETLDIKVDKYYSSEIDKYANQATQALYPNVIQLGDVTKWREWDIDWSSIDLLLGGSPCQGFSFAGKQAGTKATLGNVEYLVTSREVYLDLKEKGATFLSQSHLFWEFVLCLDFVKLANPKVKFMLENVRMKKELLEMITDALSVDHVCINSALVSAQNRVRYYWTNIGLEAETPTFSSWFGKTKDWGGSREEYDRLYPIHVEQPEDKGIKLIDILECDISIDKWKHTQAAIDYMNRKVKGGRTHWDFKHHSDSSNDKAQCVTANFHKGVPYNILIDRRKSRAITCTECTGNNPQQYYDKRKKNLVFMIPRGNNPGGLRGQDGKTPTLTSNSWEQNFFVINDLFYRKFTTTECMRLQTIPQRHIETLLSAGISNTQLYKMTGNGWTHDVIVHIFKGLLQ